MPRVPVYDGLQVGASTLPQARLSIPDAPDAGAPAQAMGQGLQQAGGAISNIALDMALQAAQVKLNDAMNQAIAAKLRLTYDPQGGYVHLKGDAAIAGSDGKPVAQAYTEQFDKALADIAGGLGNEQQRQLFSQQAATLRRQFSQNLAAHTAREFGVYRQSVQEGTVALGREQMQLAWGDDEALAQARAAIRAAVVEQGRLQGLSAVQTQANLVATLSDGHKGAIGAAIDAGQLDRAQALMDGAADEMLAADKTKLGAVLHESRQAAAAQEAVDELIQTYAGRAAPDVRVNTALPLAQMKADLREQLAASPETLALAQDLLDRRHKEAVQAQKERDESTLDDTFKALFENGGDMAALPARLRMAIPGEKLGAVMEFSKKAANFQHNPLAWAGVLSLPEETLAAMTPVEFYARFRPMLDDAHLEKGYALLKTAQQAEHGSSSDPDGKHLEIISVAKRVKETAIAAGIIPPDGKATPEQLAALAKFERLIDEDVRRFEQVDLQGRQKANSQQLQKILDARLLDTVNVQQGSWVDAFWPDKTDVPLFTLSDEQMQKAYVTVNGQDIGLSSIPAGARAQIINELQTRGLPVTEQAIAQLWVMAGKPKE